MEPLTFTVALICMEPSRPATLRTVAAGINREGLPVTVRVIGLASALVRTAEGRQRVSQGVATADAVLVSHVVVDEEIGWLEEILRRDTRPGTPLVVTSSAASLMRLTRLGRFHFPASDRKTSPRSQEDPQTGDSVVQRLRTLMMDLGGGHDFALRLKELMLLAPRVLPLLPGGMRDLRSYLEAWVHLLEPSVVNLRSLLLMLADRYHAPLRGKLRGTYSLPEHCAPEGIYHPDAPALFVKLEEHARWRNQQVRAGPTTIAGRVGILVLRSDILSGDTLHIDATIREIESRGMQAIAAFGESFDQRGVIERLLLGAGIDVLVSMTAFPLVGGHVRSDPEAAAIALAGYNLPYIVPVPLLLRSIDEWTASRQGLDPMGTALHISLPELEGGTDPIVTSGVSDAGYSTENIGSDERGGKQDIPERTAHLANRLRRRVALRQTPNCDKRIAITIFAFPPGRGAVGTAAYLDVFRSLHATLTRLRDEGYTIDLPASPEAIIEDLIPGTTTPVPASIAELTVAARLDTESYRSIAGAAVERATPMWGAPPGHLNTNGRDLLVHGRCYGNIFVGIQPSFGLEGDPMRLLFAYGASPHHGFIAYYSWITKMFCADAHLHFGTHGALEFMPGKTTGLGSDCWPDMLIGEVPNFYFYAINNPGEGSIARRRALATLIGYMTPPMEQAGLYRGLESLRSTLIDYRTSQPGCAARARLFETLLATVDDLHLDRDLGLSIAQLRDAAEVDEHERERFAGLLHAALLELESRLIPTGLHVAGRAPQPEALLDLLAAIAEHERPTEGIASIAGIVAVGMGLDLADIFRCAEQGDATAVDRLREVREVVAHGIAGMVQALREVSTTNHATPIEIATRRITTAVRLRSAARRELDRSMAWLADVALRAGGTDEMDHLMRGLAGGYIPPGVGSDPVRNPAALPSGRNIHALDPTTVPTPSAMRSAQRVVELLLERSLTVTGRYPECVGMVLWGLDTIKTGGESLAQAFILAGVVPVAGSLGRMTSLRVIPLQELGRPRIDVTVQASGIFRDIFGMQLALLDEAFSRAAALDEPEDMNHIRRRTREISEELGIPLDQAAIRVFSNAPGAYGTNIDMMISGSTWESRADLTETFVRRKSFSWRSDGEVRESSRILEALASGIDTTFQNLDSSEVGITDVDHYFEYLGGLTALVERRRGTAPTAFVADTTAAHPRVRTLAATIRLEARTRLLNPKWYEGMLSHGYQGVEEIRKRFDYTFGFGATTDAVDDWIYDEVHDIYVADATMAERMRRLNLYAYNGLARRLAEAADRGLWTPIPERADALRRCVEETEDAVEGIS